MPPDVLTGDPVAGREWFHSEGGCTECHSVEGDLAGVGTRHSAVNLLFAGDTGNNLVALDARDGALLRHTRLHTPMSNGPITYTLDGYQYLVVGAGDTLYAFVMLGP